MLKTVRVTRVFDVEIPDDDIPEMLQNYIKGFDSSADEDSLFEQVAYSDSMGYDSAEGIGEIGNNGIECDEDRESMEFEVD